MASANAPASGADVASRFTTGLMLAAVGSVLFSGKAIVVKLAYRHGVDAETLIALRMIFAVPFFAVALWWTSRGAAPLTRAQHLRLCVIGLLAYGGIVLVFWHDVRLDGDGVVLGGLLVFGSAICYGLYLVMSGELVQKVGAIRLTSYAMIVATAAVLLQFLLMRPLESLAQPPPVLWLSAINGLFCTVLPVFATMLAVARIGAGNASLMGMIGPVSTIGLGYLFLGEPVTVWQLAGTALVLAGVYVLSRKGAAAKPQPVPE